MIEARHVSPGFVQKRAGSPSQSSLSSYLTAASRSQSTQASRPYSRCALLTSSNRKSAPRHKFPGLKPKKGKAPVKRTVQCRNNSISVKGLPPGLATMLVTDGKSKDVGGQTFHYPTMLMLRILRTQGRRPETQVPCMHREKSAQLSTVQLELDCEVRAPVMPRCKSVPRPRLSLDSRPRILPQNQAPSPLPSMPSFDGRDSTTYETEQRPTEKTTRKTIFMRKEGCVCYSIPSLQNNREKI